MPSLKDNRVLEKMLERLFAALVNGPSLNARPHSSRQRIDFTQFARLGDGALEPRLRDLLGEAREARFQGRVPQPPKRAALREGEERQPLTAEERAAQQAWSEQQAVISKCRTIAEDARTYENDTGVHILQIGFPILSLPPGCAGLRGLSRRILAPVCFVTASLTVRNVPSPCVTLECRNDGADLVVPNVALLAWLEQQAGRPIGELDADESGGRPWEEVASILARVSEMLRLELPESLASAEAMERLLQLEPCPRSDDEQRAARIVPAAVVGLFPLTNQGLIRDTQILLEGEVASGPIEHFVHLESRLDAGTLEESEKPAAPEPRRTRCFGEERLITHADPCQARAVRRARLSRSLVVHGPPGTGKSQTIANIIGDHLAHGERVLFVSDKRTALDVVMNRLDGMGLASLCAVVHDPHRDQRDLYKSVRDQLEGLPELRTDGGVEKELARIDRELQQLHEGLTAFHSALMDGAEDEVSFHELVGEWFSIPTEDEDAPLEVPGGLRLDELENHAQPVHELLERGIAAEYAANEWRLAAGIGLPTFLGTPMEKVRRAVTTCVEMARAADAVAHPEVPRFTPEDDVAAAGRARVELAAALSQAPCTDRVRLGNWLKRPADALRQQARQIDELEESLRLIEGAPLDAELHSVVAGRVPPMSSINAQLATLAAFIASSQKVWHFLAFGKKKAAAGVLAPYGLTLSVEAAQRVHAFLLGLRSRHLATSLSERLDPQPTGASARDDVALLAVVRDHQALFRVLISLHQNASTASLHDGLLQATQASETLAAYVEGLAKSAQRADAVAGLEGSLGAAGLFDAGWLATIRQQVRAGAKVSAVMTDLADRLGTLESLLRIRETLASVPPQLAMAVEQLLQRSAGPEAGWRALRRAVLSQVIGSRLQSDPRLQSADTHTLQSRFQRYRQLEAQKQVAVRRHILHLWGTRQKGTLLASTGSRLSSVGADVRRRFVLRGERAMRLRQVIAVGQNEGVVDPLFDLRPVWMASPETVAQVFPRRVLFDVVVFDEASQCRLEEALPVLLRARRVVIAGDPRQLPPTRFFESAVAASDHDDVETDEQMFEAQQREIEDLLGAALNIETDEAYLDVHYRSRNADLIRFSNEHFYSSRLQPIPGHPANRVRFAPLTLYAAEGVYEERCNEAEALRVCQIVRDLLRRATPPSIGIACFNISQRDLILEKLESLAAEDAGFARAIAAARDLRRNGQFEGLFVKNLENVQGDERDHIIISTTYGPDASGKFYRRFGPLGRAGGGRRLNVLVTRAREEVHLVTSIPASVYRSLPPVPTGQVPGGGWLLFSYLKFAEELAALYEQANAELTGLRESNSTYLSARDTAYPSRFCSRLAEHLVAAHRTGANVYWGNDGFCVDLALRHPERVEDVTVGVICDTTRFALAADPVEWEIFRTTVLESQGWCLHRLWTPQFFRNDTGCMEALLQDVRTFLANEPAQDALPVQRPDDEIR